MAKIVLRLFGRLSNSLEIKERGRPYERDWETNKNKFVWDDQHKL